MKRRLFRSTAASLGLATICGLWIVGPLVVPSHDTVYHWSGPASTLFISSLLEFLCIWFISACLLFLAKGARHEAITLWAGITLFLPLAAFKSIVMIGDWGPPRWISPSLFGLCAVSFLVFLICRRFVHQATLERLRELTIDVLCIVAIWGGTILAQMAWFGWQARWLNVPLPLHQAMSSPTRSMGSRPRIIWIVLDELSYQQTYGQRFHTLNLPTFDQLAKQSTIFTSVVPAGFMTEVIMPSLIAGLPIDQIQPSSNGVSLKIHNPVAQEWRQFDQHNTVFSDALTAGYHTAIAGWYNPYCRILPEVLDRCFWTLDRPAPNKMLPGASIASNILNPIFLSTSIMDHLPSAISPESNAEELAKKTHISDYLQISSAADQLLKNPLFDFILIHMAVPHPTGIYNRTTQAFTTRNATYLDNLALADSYLAHVRSLLEAEGQWEPSAIVIMGDHSWRTKLWATTADWTSEEQEATEGNHFDDRPAYIVKLPKQNVGTTINTAFSAIDTRRLLNAIMTKRIVSPEELSVWIEAQNRKRSQN